MKKKMFSLVGLVCSLVLFSSMCFAFSIEVVTDANGQQPQNSAGGHDFSLDGKYLTFMSLKNVVPEDTNGVGDVFVKNRESGAVERVSVSSNGEQGVALYAGANNPVISEDGSLVFFCAYFGNLVPGDTNGVWDVFVHNRITGTTEILTKAYDGTPTNGFTMSKLFLTADNSKLFFESDASNLVPQDINNTTDVFVMEIATRVVTRVSVGIGGAEANGQSRVEGMSKDGRYLVYDSGASNLIYGDSNNTSDVFLYDSVTGTTTRVNRRYNGSETLDRTASSAISGNGRYIAFSSTDTMIVPGDTNGWDDVFVYDQETHETVRVSVSSTDIEGNCRSDYPDLSDDGEFISFTSISTNLIETQPLPAMWHVYAAHWPTRTIELISKSASGDIGNDSTMLNSISSNGRFYGISSHSSNLIPNDTNGHESDVFVVDMAEDADGDSYFAVLGQGDCNDDDFNINAGASEIPYNGVDENCNGLVDDDDLDHDGYGIASDCNDLDATIHPVATEIEFDGIDQDCNDYDLTINITNANYDSATSTLTVKATSTLNASANLTIVGYGPMTFKSNKNDWMLNFTGPNPGSVTVVGPEGAASKTVTAL